MKRSQVNRLIQEAINLFDAKQFKLPPFAFYTVDDWAKLPDDALIKPLKLGWDVTDFGSGDFFQCLVTIDEHDVFAAADITFE